MGNQISRHFQLIFNPMQLAPTKPAQMVFNNVGMFHYCSTNYSVLINKIKFYLFYLKIPQPHAGPIAEVGYIKYIKIQFHAPRAHGHNKI